MQEVSDASVDSARRDTGGILQRTRRSLTGRLTEGALHTATRIGRLHPLARPGRHGIDVDRDIPYLESGRSEHTLDIYRPLGSTGPMPVVLYIHGGAFRILSKDTHWMMGLMFAGHGYLTVSINYRLAPQFKFPAAPTDAAAAYRWVVENIADHGGDPRSIVLAGESAGANLVSALTIMNTFRRPEPFARDIFDLENPPVACAPACGILQVSNTARFRERGKYSKWVVEQIEACEEAYLDSAGTDPGATELADPLNVVESDTVPERPLPPFFTFVGTRDPLIDDTRRLEAALWRRGVPVESRYYAGGVHAFHAVPVLKTARRCWGDMFAFLDDVVGHDHARYGLGAPKSAPPASGTTDRSGFGPLPHPRAAGDEIETGALEQGWS